MFEVKIKNFQAIRNAHLSFPPGLTVIVGQSNTGKTNIFRAIRALVFNRASDSYITVGETYTAVQVGYNGHTVTWKRDTNLASKNLYQVDGESYHKMGRGQFDLVADSIRMPEITMMAKKEQLNFMRQMAYPFLLDRSETELFEFLSMTGDSDSFRAIQKTMKDDLLELGREKDFAILRVDDLTHQQDGLQKKIRLLSPVDKVLEDAVSITSKVAYLEDFESLITSSKKHTEEVRLLDQEIIRLSAVIPASSTLNQLEKYLNSLDDMQTTISRCKKLEEQISSFKIIVESSYKKEQFYKEILQEIEKSIAFEKKVQSFADVFIRIGDLTAQIKTLQTTIDGIDLKIESVNNQLKEFKACPTCQRPFKEDE